MTSNSPTVKQLRYFAHVVEAGSINRAADELHVAQTALGLQVRALEGTLRAPLLSRHHRGVAPTEAGRFVYQRALQILRTVDGLRAEVAQLSVPVPRELCIGMPPSLMREVGARAVLLERNALPGIHLHIVEAPRENLVRGLRSREFEYVFAHDLDSDETLRAVPLLRQALVLVSAPNSGLGAGPIAFAEAIATKLVVRGATSRVLELVKRTASDFGLAPNIVFEIDSIHALTTLIQQGSVAAIVPAALVMDEVRRGELEIHRIVDPPLEMILHFVMRRSSPPSRADLPLLVFLDDLLDDFIRENGAEDRRLGRLTTLAILG